MRRVSAESLKKIGENIELLQSIPPGCQQNIKGLFNVKVKTIYLNTYRQKLAMRCRFWGMQGEGIAFEAVDESTKQMSLSVRSTIESLSKYLSDMKLLCIEVITQPEEHIQGIDGIQKRTKIPKQGKEIGWIFVNLQRYIISHILNNFQETVNIVDLRKQKIGQAKLIVTLDMFKQEIIMHQQLQSEVKIPEFHKIQPKSSFENQHIFEEKKMKYQHQKIKREIIPSRDPGYRNSINESMEFERQIERQKQKIKMENLAYNQTKKKSRAQLFIQEYERNKPQHSQLSLIRRKYGFNLPSVQVMKLKYDQARLLTNNTQKIFKQEARINLLLKSIKFQGKQKADHLMIYCEQRQNKLKTQTKILLPQEINNQKIQINYLYTVPNHPHDVLAFQLKDARFQAYITQIMKSDKIQLRGKNNKRIAVLQYTLISEDGVRKSKLHEISQKKQQKQDVKKGQKIKQHAYINVLNWKQDRIVLKNKNFGTVKASKMLFQIGQVDSLDLTIELQHDNRSISEININLSQLFKEQNYTVEGRSIKVITSRGQLSQILALLEKLEPEKIEHQTTNEVITKQKAEEGSDKAQILKQLVKVYVNLQDCQNVQCHQILQQLTSQSQTSKKKLQKFANIIQIQPNILKKVLSNIFGDNFQQFFSSFRVFHDWNHKYKQIQKKIKNIISGDIFRSSLSKIIRKIKRSSELMFGLISHTSFLNQYIKQGTQNQRLVTEHMQNEIDYEQMGKLIVMVFERYHNRFIKISEIQDFLNEHHKYFNLNSYLLLKLVQQLNHQRQDFSEYLNHETEVMLNIFNSKLPHPTQFGLAKLLLTSQEDLIQSSVLSVEQNVRKYTEENVRKQTEFREQDLKFRTQQSKQPFHIKLEQQKQHYNNIHDKEQQQDKSSKISTKNITIIIKGVYLPNNQQITQIVFNNEKENVVMNTQMLQFPKAIVLIENCVYNVKVKSNEEQFEGVFLASPDPKKVKLYRKEKQCGLLQLFAKNNNQFSQESQVVVKLTSEQISYPKQSEISQKHIFQQEKYEQINMKQDESMCIKSPFVKISIRSIRPTRSHFALQIINQTSGQSKKINYPDQNQIIISNASKWNLKLLNELYESITILNHKGSHSYCFVNCNTQKVGYIAVIQIQQCWNASPALDHTQSLYICLNFDRFLSLKQFQAKTYNFVLQIEKDIFQIGSIENTAKGTILQSQMSYKINRRVGQINVKLICNQSKDQICSFKFMNKLIEKGVQKSERFLRADKDGYRLKISIYQLRNEWNYFKPDKIINLFTYPHKKTIESFLHEYPSITQQRLIFWLKNTFQLTLGEIQILFHDVLSVQPGTYLQCLQKLFTQIQLGSCQNIGDILQQFTIFDLEEKGVISQTQMVLVKRILQRNFKQVYNFLNENYQKYITSPEKQENFIVDLSKVQNIKDFDYLSFLSLFQDSLQSTQIVPRKEFKIEGEKSKNLTLKLVSFNKLSINGSPATLLFKINGQNLAEPIHRCYSHIYTNPSSYTIKNEGNQYLQIFCQKLSAQGNWEYKLVEKVVLSREIKILGGTINFQISQTNQVGDEMVNNVEINNKKLLEEKIERKENQPSNIEKQEDFSKSFWNKSLSQTRQKWLNANKSGTSKKEGRKLPEIDRQQIRKKMNFFNKQWDD